MSLRANEICFHASLIRSVREYLSHSLAIAYAWSFLGSFLIKKFFLWCFFHIQNTLGSDFTGFFKMWNLGSPMSCRKILTFRIFVFFLARFEPENLFKMFFCYMWNTFERVSIQDLKNMQFWLVIAFKENHHFRHCNN